MRRPALLRTAVSLCLLPLALSAQPAPAGPTSAPKIDAPAEPRLKLKPPERLPQPLIAAASADAVQALQRFKVLPGFNVSLYAAEPLLANPVAFTFDEKGRLYVAETYRYGSSVLDIRNYMPFLEQDLATRTLEDRTQLIKDWFGPAGERGLAIESEIVRLVDDRDGDGTADHSSVFADGFNTALDGIASGVLARDGKVWLTNIPHLWLLDGPDAQGKSTGRTSLSYGYGVRFNYTGHDMHGLIMGPDGKLYFSIGDRGAHVKTKEGRVIALPDTGGVFRSNPDGTELELVHSGLRNPQELAFDDYGNLFTGDNDSDQGDVERWVQLVEGGDSGWRVGYQFAPLGKAGPWNREKMWLPRWEGQASFLLPPIINIDDGPSGLTHYPGTGMPAEFRDAFFLAHFKGSIPRSGVQMYQFKPKGASFEVTVNQQFLWGTLATDVDFGPDGRLYISDWGHGWAKSKEGRIYAVAHPEAIKDPLVKETQKLLAEGMKGRPDTELVALLGHADQRVRREAQYALAARGTAGARLLQPVALQNASQFARIHALWALGQIARKDGGVLSPVLALLRDADPEIRAQTARIIGDARLGGGYDGLLAALKDESLRVRFFAAQGLGKLGRKGATPALLTVLRENADQDLYLRHAALMGLLGSNDVPALLAASTDASRSVRLGVLLALRRLGHAEIARFLNDADPLLVTEAARAINDEPIAAAMPALAALITRPGLDEPTALRVINAHYRLGGAERAKALASFVARPEVAEPLRLEALTQLAAWAEPLQRDRIVGTFRPLAKRDAGVAAQALAPVVATLLTENSEPVLLATLGAAAQLKITGAGDALVTLALRADAPPAARAATLRTLSDWKHPKLGQAVKAAGLSESPTLRAAAQEFYKQLSPAEALPLLEHAANAGTVIEQKSAFGNLAALGTPAADAVLATWMNKLLTRQLAPELQVELLAAVEQRDTPALKDLLAQRETSLATAAPVQKYEFALAGGNGRIGRTLFNEHPVLACVRCHKVGGEGGEAGPALDTLADRKPRDYILESIVAPNAHIAEGFETVTLTLKGGGLQVGSIAGEDETSVTLRPASGEGVVKVAKADIAQRESAPSSMPEIYGLVLTRGELRDLVEYVGSLKAKPGATPKGEPAGEGERTTHGK